MAEISQEKMNELASCPEGQMGVAAADLMAQINQSMCLRALDLIPHDTTGDLLEVGFGAGSLRHMIAARNRPLNWVGLEKSETMCEIARRLPGYEVQLGVAEALPFEDARFAIVVALNTLCWWDDPMVAFAEIRRVLQPGGSLVINIVLPNAITRRNEQYFPRPRYFTASQVVNMLRVSRLPTMEIVQDDETVEVTGEPTSRSYILFRAVKGDTHHEAGER